MSAVWWWNAWCWWPEKGCACRDLCIYTLFHTPFALLQRHASFSVALFNTRPRLQPPFITAFFSLAAESFSWKIAFFPWKFPPFECDITFLLFLLKTFVCLIIPTKWYVSFLFPCAPHYILITSKQLFNAFQNSPPNNVLILPFNSLLISKSNSHFYHIVSLRYTHNHLLPRRYV